MLHVLSITYLSLQTAGAKKSSRITDERWMHLFEGRSVPNGKIFDLVIGRSRQRVIVVQGSFVYFVPPYPLYHYLLFRQVYSVTLFYCFQLRQ